MSSYAWQRLPFFVYGTLIPGQPNDHLWQGAIGSLEAAVFDNGRLYDMGFYPMLVEGRAGMVKGKLIRVDGDWVPHAARRYNEISSWWTAVTTVSGLHDDFHNT